MAGLVCFLPSGILLKGENVDILASMSTILIGSKGDDSVASALASYLRLTDDEIMQCDSQTRLMATLHQEHIDLVILCLGDDIVKGFSLLKALREKTAVPVIILSSRGDESDRIMAFELGCDDYLTSPFSYKEISLRVRSCIKRSGQSGEARVRSSFVNGRHTLTIDRQSHKLSLDGNEIGLTVSEWKIFSLLVDNTNSVLSRIQIMESCFGYLSESYDRVVDTHIKNIRSKLGPDAKAWIETVRGYGYCFSARPVRD